MLNEQWQDRFVWRGEDGRGYFANISVEFFLRDLPNMTVGPEIFNTDKLVKFTDFYDAVDRMAVIYELWCKKNERNLPPFAGSKLQNHFKGCMGELFFTEFINANRKLVLECGDGKKRQFTFDEVKPRPENCPYKGDYGVDMVSEVTVDGRTWPCVFQAKMWNPYSPEIMTYDILSNTYTDGVRNGLINPMDNGNIFLCWTGLRRHVSPWLWTSPIGDCVTLIGQEDVDFNRRDVPKFFRYFFDFLGNV